MRLIDADLLELDTEWSEYMDGFTSYSQFQIDNAPTIEAEPVRHGRWIDGTSRGSYSIYCSYCGSHKETICPSEYCPACGARMDAKE